MALTEVYIEGTCDPSRGEGHWSVSITGTKLYRSGYVEATTHVRMQMIALVEAHQLLAEIGAPSAVIVCGDWFINRAFNRWLTGWERRNWKGKTKEIKNVDLWKIIARLRRPEWQVMSLSDYLLRLSDETDDKRAIAQSTQVLSRADRDLSRTQVAGRRPFTLL